MRLFECGVLVVGVVSQRRVYSDGCICSGFIVTEFLCFVSISVHIQSIGLVDVLLAWIAYRFVSLSERIKLNYFRVPLSRDWGTNQ